MVDVKKIALLLSAGMLLLGGCNVVHRMGNATPDEVNDSPLVVDSAMQLRDWSRSTSLYANGDTPAGPTGFLYEPTWNQPEWHYAALETPLFIVQTVALPVTLIVEPPTKTVMYTGATVTTTYTAMPALPPSNSAVVVEEVPPLTPTTIP